MYKNMEISTKEEDYIGKYLTYKQVVELFPDRWVGFSDYVFDGADFVEGMFQFARIDKEKSNIELKLIEQGYKIYSFRTTDLPGGALWL